MDTEFRQSQRMAAQAGRGSPEDVAYISIQRRMGLGLNLIVAAAELGDISAHQYLVNQGINEVSGMVTSSAALHNNDFFRHELFLLLNRCVVPMALSIRWLIACDKQVLAMVYAAKTGRGGLYFTKKSDPEGLQVLHETSRLLTGLAGWEENSEHTPYITAMEEYPHHPTGEIPLGIRQHILSHLVEATGSLLEAIVVCKVTGTLLWQQQQLPGEHGKPGDALISRIIADHLDQVVRHIISRSISPPYSLGKNATFIAYRQASLQHFADILLNRSWNFVRE